MHWKRAMKCVFAVCVWATFAAGAHADGGDYLIVAAEGFAASPHLTSLANARTTRGFDVTIYSVPAGTSKAAIKSYIEAWYSSPGDSYVLIVGDSDSSTDPSTATTIPHWNGGGTMGAPTDLPYACMDAGDDWYPEIFLGRFAIDTEAELEAIVDKTLFVEAGVFPDPTYAKRAALLATGDSSANAEHTQDAIIAQYLDPAGFTSTRVYADQGGDTNDVIAALNAGSLFCAYIGHSSNGSWWEPAFYVSHIQALTNQDLYGLALAFSCSSAGFDWWYAECLGEVWIREANKGGAAFIGTTTLLPVGSDMWEPSRRLEHYFFNAMLNEDTWRVGPAWHAALHSLWIDPDYGPSHEDTRDHFELFAILGDPALILPHEAAIPGDIDKDSDVDLADFALLANCLTGPNETTRPPGCDAVYFARADLEGDDGDVDVADFAAFQEAFDP